MKSMKIDLLLYHPELPEEMRVEVRIPMADEVARRLVEAQRKGMCIVEQTALYRLAAEVGRMNGVEGIPLRLEEVGG